MNHTIEEKKETLSAMTKLDVSRPIHRLSDVLKAQFGQKVIKLSIDGGFTCPNRDGTKGTGGCSFCSSRGSGEFTSGAQLPIAEQMAAQVRLLSAKWPHARYIAYFQNFSNTYAAPEILRTKYDEALSFPGAVGLAIATRPDCIDASVAQLLAEYSRRTYLWVELGIQTVREQTARAFGRGYTNAEADAAFARLRCEGIRTVAHMIIGLPGESESDYAATLESLVNHGIWGIKMHMLNILRNTGLAERYRLHPFALPDLDDYIRVVCDLLEMLPPEVTVHRLTGDGSGEDLIAPQWIRDKRAVLNGIHKELRRRHSYQGRLCRGIAPRPESESR